MEHGSCKHQTLCLPFRQFPGRFFPVFVEVYLMQDFLDPFFGNFQDFREIFQILPDGQIFIDSAAVGYDSNLLIDGFIDMAGIDAENIGVSGSRLQLSGQDFYSSCLPGAAGTEKS